MVSRRECVKYAGGVAALALGGAPAVAEEAPKRKPAAKRLAIPGLYRGRVVSVRADRSIANGVYHPETIREMLHRGMKELTGAEWVDAWKQFVEPGDVVGLKLNPVGLPHVI